jgi:hypothetical protein
MERLLKPQICLIIERPREPLTRPIALLKKIVEPQIILKSSRPAITSSFAKSL